MITFPRAIRVENLSHQFGSKRVLSELSVIFDGAKTHAVLGASGSGKSTLFRILMGLIVPTEGRVFYGDLALTPENQREMALRIGYVIQDAGLFPHLSIWENLTLVMRAYRHPEDQVDARIMEMGRLLRLDRELLHRFPSELSGGQRQRVGVARALMLDPQILLMDEPLGALDPIVRSDLQHELKELFSVLRKTVLLVTHDLREAAFLAERVVLLGDGKVVQQGTIEELYGLPVNEYARRFISAQSPTGRSAVG